MSSLIKDIQMAFRMKLPILFRKTTTFWRVFGINLHFCLCFDKFGSCEEVNSSSDLFSNKSHTPILVSKNYFNFKIFKKLNKPFVSIEVTGIFYEKGSKYLKQLYTIIFFSYASSCTPHLSESVTKQVVVSN